MDEFTCQDLVKYSLYPFDFDGDAVFAQGDCSWEDFYGMGQLGGLGPRRSYPFDSLRSLRVTVVGRFIVASKP